MAEICHWYNTYMTIHSTVNYTRSHTHAQDMVICEILNITIQHGNGYTTQ